MTNQYNEGDMHSLRAIVESLRKVSAALPLTFDLLESENFSKLLKEAETNEFLKETKLLLNSMIAHQRLRHRLTSELNLMINEVGAYLIGSETPVLEEKARHLLLSIMKTIKTMVQIIHDAEPNIDGLKDSLRASVLKMDEFLASGEE